MIVVEHAYDDCVGQWRLRDSADAPCRECYCDGCDASYPATQDIRLAAIDENYAGIYLRRLTEEGAGILAAERDT